ncbi:MAG: hypothetical protein ABI687_01390 [Flavitalea sp.]
MSLKDLVLTDELIASLYGHSLVDLGNSAETLPVAAVGVKLNYLGNNEKHIAIIINDPDHAFLPEEQLSFLIKMLGACKLNIGDVAIINQSAASFTFTGLLKQLNPSSILFFGVSPSSIEMPSREAFFAIEAFDNGLLLQAPSLAELNSDSEEAKPIKSKLWNCLKQVFAVK